MSDTPRTKAVYKAPRSGYDEMLQHALTKAARFGLLVLRESREGLTDLDGGWLQDCAEQCGLLHRVKVTEACGTACRCAEYYDEWPSECLRPRPAVLAVLALLESKLKRKRKTGESYVCNR
jgi:hypothetical protein